MFRLVYSEKREARYAIRKSFEPSYGAAAAGYCASLAIRPHYTSTCGNTRVPREYADWKWTAITLKPGRPWRVMRFSETLLLLSTLAWKSLTPPLRCSVSISTSTNARVIVVRYPSRPPHLPYRIARNDTKEQLTISGKEIYRGEWSSIRCLCEILKHIRLPVNDTTSCESGIPSIPSI